MIRPLSLFLVLCLAVPAVARAQKPDPGQTPVVPKPARSAQVPNPGRAVPISGQVYLGEAAPDFELEATTGQRVKLTSLHGQDMLVVFADRRTRLDDLDGLAVSLQKLHVRVAAVIHENLQALQSHTHREALTYLALADPTGEIAAMYGLWDELRSATRPGVVMLDHDGNVRFMLAGQDVPAAQLEQLVQFASEGL